MRNTHGYIPKNMGGGTIWDGRLKIRNTVESVTLAFIIYFITSPLYSFIPGIVVTSVRAVLWLIFCGLALRGIGGEPLSIWFLNVINYSNSRTYATLQPPQRELEVPEKKKRNRKEKSKAKESDKRKTATERKLEKLEKKEAKRKQKEARQAEKAAAKAEKKKGRSKEKPIEKKKAH